MSIARLREQLDSCLDPAAILDSPEAMAPYCTDWLGRWRGRAALVVRPANTQQVALVHRLCAQMRIPLVPQGGNTGMSGGATPNDFGEQVVISLQRLNRVRALDPVNNTLTVDAGVLLGVARQAARERGRLLPLSLGSEGSCTIGGNLATNAGGIQALRYGTMRDLVLGIEVVLPDGRIWDGMRSLRKNNTGYDLKHLFVGSEGTLGTITGAVLSLTADHVSRATAWLHAPGLADLAQALALLRQRCGGHLCAFEMMEPGAVALVRDHLPHLACPVARTGGVHALVELGGAHEAGLQAQLEQALAAAQADGHVDDVAVALTDAQATQMWRVREGVSLAQVQFGTAIKHDIALPVSAIEGFCAAAREALAPWLTDPALGLRLVNFGHLGDGNLHFNVLVPRTAPADEARHIDEVTELAQRIQPVVHDLVHAHGGCISAEHGIGQLRREDNRRYKSSVEMDLMMAMKRALDPNQIMNPGKLL